MAQKQMIPLEKIEEMAAFLKTLSTVADEAVGELKTNGSPGFPMEGWPTLCRGLGYALDQIRKLATPSNPVHLLDVADLMISESTKSQVKRADAAMIAAESTASYKKKKD